LFISDRFCLTKTGFDHKKHKKQTEKAQEDFKEHIVEPFVSLHVLFVVLPFSLKNVFQRKLHDSRIKR
jgi:hypothetical protein